MSEQKMDRVILHCDCNSFFASVETVLHPEYRDVPMAVCGSEEDRHGIVLAKNELAKKYGIQTAETVHAARKKCPGLVVAPPHHKEYMKYSRRVNDIYRQYTELVEPFGIDESWLDVTASRRLFGTGEEIAEEIRARVKREIGITVSIGVSFNKVFAKLGSDYKKPDAITVISRENYKSIVHPLPVSDLLFVGKKTADRLASLGIRTIGELAMADPAVLSLRFGKMGELLSIYARGEDDTPVSLNEGEQVKSIGNGLTFKRDLVSREDCLGAIEYLCEEIGSKLRRRRLKCSTVALTVKDEYLVSVQRQRPIGELTDIGGEIARCAYMILCTEWSERKPIRMINVTVSGLVDSESCVRQLYMFENEDDGISKSKKREELVDKIRQKYGDGSIIRGSVIGSDIGIYKDEGE